MKHEVVGQAPVYEDANGVFVYICDQCGQALQGPDDVCNSGYHVGPSGERKGHAVPSHNYVLMKRDA